MWEREREREGERTPTQLVPTYSRCYHVSPRPAKKKGKENDCYRKLAGKVLITFQRVAQDETSLRKRTNKIANRTKGCTELRIR